MTYASQHDILLNWHMQVYVTVYSDGPTRVLRLSDEPNITSREAEQSVLDLAARLKQASDAVT